VSFTVPRRTDTDEPLGLTREHELIVRPRKGEVHWDQFDARTYEPAHLEAARTLWRHRAFTEFHSLTHFTQLASQVQRLGLPLEWSGAFVRMCGDEVRHTELCLRMLEALGGERDLVLPSLDETHLTVRGSLRAHVRSVIVSAFCIGETLSGRMFKRCLAAATVPLAREVVTAILVDETFHAELGWELAALLMRPDADFELERRELAQRLPSVFSSFAEQCLVTRHRAWTDAQPERDEGPGFGGLSDAGYAQAFFAGMEEDVVPGLEAIGFPEAPAAWQQFLATLT
jgi:hypothetical protein